MTYFDTRPIDAIAAKEGTRYAIDGIRVRPMEGEDVTIIEATNGRALARIHAHGNSAHGVIPAARWKELRTGSKGDTRTLETFAGRWTARIGDREIAGDVSSDISFPDTDQVIPQTSPDVKVRFSAKLLHDLVLALANPDADRSERTWVELGLHLDGRGGVVGPMVVRAVCSVSDRDVGVLMPVDVK